MAGDGSRHPLELPLPSLELLEKVRQPSLELLEKVRQPSLELLEKVTQPSLGLLEKVRQPSLELLEKVRQPSLELLEKVRQPSLELLEKVTQPSLGLLEKVRQPSLELLEKPSLELLEKVRQPSLELLEKVRQFNIEPQKVKLHNKHFTMKQIEAKNCLNSNPSTFSVPNTNSKQTTNTFNKPQMLLIMQIYPLQHNASQIAISETLKIQIFLGEDAPRPPTLPHVVVTASPSLIPQNQNLAIP